MPRALILGGSGAIGIATARRLLGAGWEVDLTGRDPHHLPSDVVEGGGRFVLAEREDDGTLGKVLGEGTDLLVDCLCYTSRHAESLLLHLSQVTSTVMISSKAVYVDDSGNHANSLLPPRFCGPIPESQPTMSPSAAPYDSPEGYGANKVAAEEVLLDSGCPVTVIRPGKVHGPGARPPREWLFVKRILDHRPVVLLAARGEGVDQPSAAVNLAALIEVVAETPGARVLNCGDPDAPSALQISRAIAAHLGHHWREVLLDDCEERDLGRHLWESIPPVVLDTTAALALGYRPVGDYAATVREEIDWLVAAARAGDPEHVLPSAEERFFSGLFDYEAEERYLVEWAGDGQ